MCGIVGMAGNLGNNHKSMLRDMVHVCEFRGEDSTGMFAVKNTDAEPAVSKVVGATRDFFETAAWDKLSLYTTRAVVVHCRKATIGGISRATAHPFKHEHITGVHNGTLKNWKDLPGDSLATDSTTLFAAIARDGLTPTIEATDGAYALVFWDAADETLNILRNRERPLTYAFSEDGTCLFFASEGWMISVMADRNGVKLMDLTPKEDYVTRTMMVSEDVLWRIQCKNSFKDSLRFLDDVALKGGVNLPKKELPFQTPGTRHGQSGYWDHGRWVAHKPLSGGQPAAGVSASIQADETSSTPNLSSTTKTPASPLAITDSRLSRPTLSLVQSNSGGGSGQSEEQSSTDDLNDSIKALFGRDLIGHDGSPLSEEAYTKDVYSECQWCQKTFDYEQLVEGHLGCWVDDDRFVCSECVAEDGDIADNFCNVKSGVAK